MSTNNAQSYPQRDKYNESFKISVVAEVVSGQITQEGAQKKYGIGGHCTVARWIMKYGSNKELKKFRKVHMPHDTLKVKELETRLRKLEKLLADKELEKEALEKIIELAEKEYKISIKKNIGPKQ